LVFALLTLILGFWLINRGMRLSRRLMDLRKIEPSLSGFLLSLSGLSLKTLLLVSVAGMLGVETTSFIAVLGAAGLAVGLALQGSLANFAGGVLVLLFKPFRVGHVIDSGTTLGTVTEIGVLNTHLKTFDGRTAIIPNGQLANNPVINLSLEPLRRAEWLFTVAPTADGETVLAHLRALVEGEGRIVTEPPPLVAMAGFTELGVQYLVRGWVAADQLWPTTYDMNARIKATLDEAGLPLAHFSEPLRTGAAP
jgi:small conductance mechanosensitive channel